MTRRRSRFKITRPRILFAAGILGIAVETLWSLGYHQTPDSTLVLVFSAMMGLPVYLAQDAKRDEHDRTTGTGSSGPPSTEEAPKAKTGPHDG